MKPRLLQLEIFVFALFDIIRSLKPIAPPPNDGPRLLSQQMVDFEQIVGILVGPRPHGLTILNKNASLHAVHFL